MFLLTKHARSLQWNGAVRVIALMWAAAESARTWGDKGVGMMEW